MKKEVNAKDITFQTAKNGWGTVYKSIKKWHWVWMDGEWVRLVDEWETF